MRFRFRQDTAGLSVVAVFHNMVRESERTLYSLSRAYQQFDDTASYEVLALDHGSTRPLAEERVRSFGREFSYRYVDAKSASPCLAINQSVASCRFDNVMILIDGARMLSPGILRSTDVALKAFKHPFVYTLGMHLGPKVQNYSVTEGYDAAIEDRLLDSVDWKKNGYALFEISSPALSSKRGFFSPIAESNCLALRKEDFLTLGGYRTQFESPGGGLCNHDLFNRVHESEWMQPVLLLGEASFHQFHGGVASNVPIVQHPWDAMADEYAQIVGEPWRNKFRPPIHLGCFREECAHLCNAAPDREAN